MAKKSYNEKLNDSKNMPEVVEITDPKAVLGFGAVSNLINRTCFIVVNWCTIIFR